MVSSRGVEVHGRLMCLLIGSRGLYLCLRVVELSRITPALAVATHSVPESFVRDSPTL